MKVPENKHESAQIYTCLNPENEEMSPMNKEGFKRTFERQNSTRTEAKYVNVII